MIGIDWGSTNFRAFRFNAAGEIVDTRFSAEGALRIQNRAFEDTLREKVGEWLAAGETRILLCGMIGSRQGWVETRYVSCPVGIADLAAALVEVPFAGAEVLLIPGVSGIDSSSIPEVMRGEETQLMGVLESYRGTGLACLPGTHTKWVQFNDEAVIRFATCMTGELYAALRQNTSLARIMTGSEVHDDEAFLRGVARSMDEGGLLHHLFGVRALTLMNKLKEDASASYLSGLLIGHEVRSAMPPGDSVHLIGDSQLCSLYAQAIQTCGGSFTLADEHAAARGLAAVGRRLSWI